MLFVLVFVEKFAVWTSVTNPESTAKLMEEKQAWYFSSCGYVISIYS